MKLSHVVVGAISFIAGGALGYFIAKKTLPKHIEIVEYIPKKLEEKNIEHPSDSTVNDVKPNSEYPEEIQKVLAAYRGETFGKVMSSIETPEVDENPLDSNPVYSNASEISYIPDALYGEDLEYNCQVLNWYMDETMATDDGVVLSEQEIVDRVGADWMDHVGEYNQYLCYVKNNVYKTYYEIDVSAETYADVYEREGYEHRTAPL